MCEQFVVLAQHTTACYIAQCEHGTLHLCWDHVSVHLRPHDFLALTQTIAALGTNHPTHKLRLGIGRLTLELRPEDYHPLLALMQRVAAQLPSFCGKDDEPNKASFLRQTRPCLN